MTDTHTTAHIPDEAVQAFCENFYGWFNLPETAEFQKLTAKAEVERALNLASPFLMTMKLPHKLERTIDSYRKMKPEAVASGSYAQILYALQDARNDILTLAAAHLSAPCAVEVKKLDWVATGQTGFLETEFYAVSGSLRNTVHPVEKEDGWFYEHYSIRRSWSNRGVWQLTYYVGNNGLSGISGNFKTLDEAKAAAQADFERRILSCVVSKPVDVAAAQEQCAQIAENFTVKDHIAHDMRMGVFPEQSKAGVAIAAAIRALSAEPAQGDQSGCAALAQGGE